MVYKFLILSDEIDQFSREIEINSDASFLEFNDAILNSVNFTKDQMTSFFICNDAWEKFEEITLIEMDTSSDTDSFLMDGTPIEEFVTDEGQRLLYIFDNLADRAFFIELKEINSGRIDKAKCILKNGTPPQQMLDDDAIFSSNVTAKNDFDTDFYGDSDFNLDELDDEGFADLSMDELSETY